MMKRTLIIAGIIVVAAIIVLIVISKVTSKKDIANLYAESEKGQFDIVVTTTGELQAKKSTDIFGPGVYPEQRYQGNGYKNNGYGP